MRMLNQSPLDSLHLCLGSAQFKNLPDVFYFRKDYPAIRRLTELETKACVSKEAVVGDEAWPGTWLLRRPAQAELLVKAMYPQCWGSTALGFGGLGGSAVTWAYTTVIEGPDGDAAVYFGGQFAYLIPAKPSGVPRSAEHIQAFQDDILKQQLESVTAAVMRYGAIPN